MSISRFVLTVWGLMACMAAGTRGGLLPQGPTGAALETFLELPIGIGNPLEADPVWGYCFAEPSPSLNDQFQGDCSCQRFPQLFEGADCPFCGRHVNEAAIEHVVFEMGNADVASWGAQLPLRLPNYYYCSCCGRLVRSDAIHACARYEGVGLLLPW